MINLYRSRRLEARAVNSCNLKSAETHLSDVDVLTARGMSGSHLGADLERLKYGCDRSAYGGCFETLSATFHRRARRRPQASLVHAALHEFLDDRCPCCGGRSAIQIDVDEFATCDGCNGTGQKRYTDSERAHACSVKLANWVHHERDYRELLDCIHSALGAHRKGMCRALAGAQHG